MKKKYLYYLLFLFICIVVTYYIIEQIYAFRNLKAQIYKNIPYRYIALKENIPQLQTIIKPYTKKIVAPFHFTPKQTLLLTDGDGYMIGTSQHEQADIKICFLGGSTTACIYNPVDIRFPALCAKLLEKSTGKKINAYNCGMGGINTMHSINILQNKVAALRPDYAIIMHNINDLVALNYYNTYWMQDAPRASIFTHDNLIDCNNDFLFFPQVRGYIYNTKHTGIEDEFIQKRKNLLQFMPDSVNKIKLFKENLVTLILICKARGIKPILMSEPHCFDILDNNWFEKHRAEQIDVLGNQKIQYLAMMRSMLAKFNSTIRDVAAEQNCPFIDLDAAIQQASYFYDEVHYNDHGCTQVAKVISENILKQLH